MRRTGSACLGGALVALSLAGCASSAPAKHSSSSGGQQATRTTGAVPVITEAEARSLLSDMAQKNNQANGVCDSSLLGQFEDEAQFNVDDAVYRVCRVMDPQHQDPIKPFQFTDPTFYRPAAAGGEQWFLVDVTAGKARTAMIVERKSTGASWKAVSQPVLTTTIPALAKDTTGNPVVVAPSDGSTLVASPEAVAAKQAAYLTAGNSAPEAAMFATDKHFDEIINDQQVRSELEFADAQTGRPVAADRITRQVTVEPYPVRALRTADDGAIAFYSTKWQLVAEKAGGVIKFKNGDDALAGGKTFHDRVTISYLSQWAVRIPPKAGGTVTVIGASTDKESIS